jgi:hypothetical protein
MPIQLASTDELQVVLDAAPTNQLPINTSYVDQGGSGGNLPSVTAGTTPVTFVASPASGVERLVNQISIPNVDTSTRIITVNMVRSGTVHEILSYSIASGSHLFYDGQWRVNDNKGNFLCNVTVTGGTLTANQGTAAPITAPWSVELSNGTNAVGTASAPLRVDPTGTTTQPVSVGNFPATQNINLTELDGAALAGPTAWGTAPSAGAQVLNVNANIVSGGSGGGNVNVTEWNTVALGSPSSYGTSPGAVAVIGVNAFVTNLPATQPISGSVSVSNFPATQASNQTQLAGTTLGAPSNYGTSPGAVSVQGVNAFVTNQVSAQLVAGSAAIGTVQVTSIPALPTGSNTIGGVTQASGPWTFNLTQVSGTSLGSPTSYGTAPSGNVIGVNANVTNVVSIDPNIMVLSSNASITTTSHQFGATATYTKLRFCKIDLVGYTNTSANTISIQDGGGTALFTFMIPAFAAATTIYGVFFSDMIAQAISNTSGGVQAVGSSNPSAGAVYVMVGASN